MTRSVGPSLPARPVEHGARVSLWLGILAPPALWAARLAAGYVLIPWVCAADARPVLHLVALTAAGATAAVALVSLRNWRRARDNARPADTLVARTRFMALLGLLNASFWFLVIAAEETSSFFIDPCLTSGYPLSWLR